ncbi:hypothetical protein VTI74DRAFT_1695 [Chaetomium olivicolor]
MSPYAGLARGVGWLESRDDNTRFIQTANFIRSRNGIFQAAHNQTTTQQMFNDELKFSAAKSIRTSTIILASLNIVAAFATAVGILCDSYFRKRRNDRNFRLWRNGFNFVPEADIYPLVVSLAIFIQSFIFAGAQSTGLNSLFGLGCTWLAHLMLPAVFIAPYTQLVFAAEVAIRALRKEPFGLRRKFNVSICLSIVGMLVLANFLVADFDRSPNFCLSSLFWFVAHYSILCFGLLVAIVCILLICLTTIFVRLYRSINVEVTARVAASRMVYYLALAVISNSFMIPFFFVQGFMDGRGQNSNALTLGMVASVAANVSGLMTGGLYLFLKSRILTTIGPSDKVGEYENRRALYENRSNGSDDNGFDRHLMNPVTGPRSLRSVDSEASLIITEKDEEALDDKVLEAASAKTGRRSPDSLRSNRLVSAVTSVLMPKAPEPARIPSSTPSARHMHKRSYSLFPRSTMASKASLMLLPATTYSPSDAFKLPPSITNLTNMRHRRDSSLVSSATVQIGIRLSSVADIPSLAQNKIITNDNEVHSLDCPNVLAELDMQTQKCAAGLSTPALASDDAPNRDPVKDAKMKTLPPVPKINSQPPKIDPAQQAMDLSPSVYSPSTPTKVKLPSPKGVGFTMPAPKSSNGVPPRSPPRRRGTGETTPLPQDAKGDWI